MPRVIKNETTSKHRERSSCIMADNDVWSWKSTQHDTTQPPSKRMSEKSRVSHHHQKESSKKKVRWSLSRRIFTSTTALLPLRRVRHLTQFEFSFRCPQRFSRTLSPLSIERCCVRVVVFIHARLSRLAPVIVYTTHHRASSLPNFHSLLLPVRPCRGSIFTLLSARRSTYNHRASTHARDHLTSVKRAPVKPIRDRTNRVFLFFLLQHIYAIEENIRKEKRFFFFSSKITQIENLYVIFS